MEPVRLAIVGCGGMGRRHLAGLAELARAGARTVDLVAVCDLNEQNAQRPRRRGAATSSARRPAVFTDMATMARETDGLEAADCTTDTGSHHRVATDAPRPGPAHPLRETAGADHPRLQPDHRRGGAERQDPLRGRELPARPDQPAGARPARRRRHRRAPVHHGDGRPRARHPLHHPLAAPEADRARSPSTPASTTPTSCSTTSATPASAFGQTRLFEKTRVARDTAGPGGFYEKWAANLPADGRGDRRGRDVRADHLRQRRARPVGRPPRRARRAVRATAWSSARAARSPPPATATAARSASSSTTAPTSPTSACSDYAPSYRLDPVGGGALRRRAPLDLRLRLRHDRPQAARAGVRRAGRVHPHRRRAGSRRRGRPRAPSPSSTPSSNRRSPAGRSRSPRSNRAPSTPTSARSTSTWGCVAAERRRDRRARRDEALATAPGACRGCRSTSAVAHCAALGFDGLELTVIPGWTTDAAGLDAGRAAAHPQALRRPRPGAVRPVRQHAAARRRPGRARREHGALPRLPRSRRRAAATRRAPDRDARPPAARPDDWERVKDDAGRALRGAGGARASGPG